LPKSRSPENTETTEETNAEIIEKEYQIRIEETSEKISIKANITLASSKLTTTINPSTTSSPLTIWPTNTKSTNPWSNHVLNSQASHSTSNTTKTHAIPVQIRAISTTPRALNTTRSNYKTTLSKKAKIKITPWITIIIENTTWYQIPNAIGANIMYY
jgi:hypothetical protein